MSSDMDILSSDFIFQNDIFIYTNKKYAVLKKFIATTLADYLNENIAGKKKLIVSKKQIKIVCR